MSNNKIEFKCSLCGKSLVNRDSNEIIQEKISGSKYFFDSNQCVMMFKRLDHFYGKNISSFTGNQDIISDPFWNKITPSEDEIQEINIESKERSIKVIKNPEEALQVAKNMVRSANKEILLLFSSVNAFYRTFAIANGFLILDQLNEDTSKKVNIRILTPFDEKIQNLTDMLKKNYEVDIKYLPEPLYLKITILIMDRNLSLALELEDDSVQDSVNAIGLSTYSNSKSTVLYYVSIFENLWKQADIYKKADDLYQQLKQTSQTQRQFINEAAHEIRNPIQPILGLAEVMLSNKNLDPSQTEDLLRIIVSNAKKLQFLTDNLLDVTRIDSHLLTLNLEEFDIVETVKHIIEDLKDQTRKPIEFLLHSEEDSILIKADKLRISQVLLNILNNAINILQEGEISVSIAKKNDILSIKISDNGPGIPINIKDKIFSKFVTGSKSGTGLGLYICKNIVEKHGGRIWAENNAEKGATFNLTIPID
ncbi:MAG: ATP-binding protein [Nitrososphaeraceae archaeon]|nr:ATP-binding protein [Nitrososphaeraceae archaeon]